LNKISDVKLKKPNELVEFELTDENIPIISNLVTSGLLFEERVEILQHGSSNSVVGHSPTELGKILLTHGF
jgi:hypothetical protein